MYDPKEGKSYDAAVALEGRSKLLMTGYKGIKLLSKTLTWTRAPAELPRCQNRRLIATIAGGRVRGPLPAIAFHSAALAAFFTNFATASASAMR